MLQSVISALSLLVETMIWNFKITYQQYRINNIVQQCTTVKFSDYMLQRWEKKCVWLYHDFLFLLELCSQKSQTPGGAVPLFMFKQCCVQIVVPLFVYRKPVIYIEYKFTTDVIGGYCIRTVLPWLQPFCIFLLNVYIQFMWNFGNVFCNCKIVL